MVELFSLIPGAIFGYLAFRERLCLVGASPDSGSRSAFLRSLAAAACASIVLTWLALAAGALELPRTPVLAPLLLLPGALLFGLSAPFTNGGVVSLLYRAGAGRLHALASLAVIITTAWFTSEAFGGTALNRLLAFRPDVAERLIGLGSMAILCVAGLALVGLVALWFSDREDASRRALRMGLVLGAVVAAGRLLSPDAGLSGFMEMEAVNTAASLIFPGTKLDSPWATGTFIGILGGAAIYAAQIGEFSVRWPRGVDPFVQLGGAAGMGAGIGLAAGGTLTHAYSGPSSLSVAALLFVAVLFPSLTLGRKLRARWDSRPQKKRVVKAGFKPSAASRKRSSKGRNKKRR